MLNFDHVPEYALINDRRLPKPAQHSFDPSSGQYKCRDRVLSGNLIIQPLTYSWSDRGEKQFELFFVDKLGQLGWIGLSQWNALDIYCLLLTLRELKINMHSLFLVLGKDRRDDDLPYCLHVISYYWVSQRQALYTDYFVADNPGILQGVFEFE